MSILEELAMIKRYLVDLAVTGNREELMFVRRMFAKYRELVGA